MIQQQRYIPGTQETVKHPGDLVLSLRGQWYRVDDAGRQQPYAGRRGRSSHNGK